MATAPAVRRNGYCRQTLAAVLAAGREDGQAFSTLYPFRESFYERLGYVTFLLARLAKLMPLVLTPLLGRDLGGRVEHVLQWIARHVDQADRVELWLATAEQPETWLADMQTISRTAGSPSGD